MNLPRAQGHTPCPASALEGVRVLDLSRVLAGPFATQILADLGAEVIKIEDPARGDETRAWGPPFAKGESAYFLSVNRGKRSVAVNLKSPDGGRIVRELALRSDVLVENFKPGDMARYGLDYQSLAALNPKLVYCSVTGFGQDGPMRDMPGYDFAVQALCGIMAVTGEPEGPPMKVGVAWVDILCGLYAAVGVLAALRARDRTGQGQHIDLALWDAGVAAMANLAQAYLVSGQEPGRYGNAHAQIVPYQLFAAADGFLVVAVGNDAQFRRFCRALGMPELADDPRYATNPARVEHRQSLVSVLAPALAAKPTAHWLASLREAKVPAAPVWGLGEVFGSQLARARGMRWTVGHPTAGDLQVVGSPFQHMSLTPARPGDPPPRLGEHTRVVLESLLGYASETVDRLAEEGAIGLGPKGAGEGEGAVA